MGTYGNIFPPSSCSQVGTMWDQNDGVDGTSLQSRSSHSQISADPTVSTR